MNPLEISADQFRRLAGRVSQLAAEYLEKIDATPIAPAINGEESLRLFQSPLPEQGMGEEALDILPEVMRSSRAQNGRFFGYVLGSGEPVAAVADLLASVLNQNVTAWRSGPAAVTIEQTVIGWLSQAIGCPGFEDILRVAGLPPTYGTGHGPRGQSARQRNGNSAGRSGLRFRRNAHVHPQERALLGIGRDNLR